jgi:hypothetical protein
VPLVFDPRGLSGAGKIAPIKMLVISDIQTKTGIFITSMPGARMRRMVTMKLIPASVVPMPESCSDQE